MNTFLPHHRIKIPQLFGRYITLEMITPILDKMANFCEISVAGHSENGQKIHTIILGNGPKRFLAWSQMHGNESTTTKAVLDFIHLFSLDGEFAPVINEFLKTYTFCCIPMLNPDGAKAYTRFNANETDLNRDASLLSQKESKVLRTVFNDFKPDLCLNLHGQRTIYSLPNKKSASLSFLAPAADATRSITPGRNVAMHLIATMNSALQVLLPGQIGRYDDAFNIDCVGDFFQSFGVPTILFEAGHYPGDYQRETTREMVFHAFTALFKLCEHSKNSAVMPYDSIPENEKLCRDVVLRNVTLSNKRMDIAIQFEEQLHDNAILFIPKVDIIGDLSYLFGHKEIDLKGEEVLINSHENVFENENISTIHVKKTKKQIIL